MNKNPRIIIAFTGPKTSGKSLAADYLVEHFDFVKINFKDALVKEVRKNFQQLLRILADKTEHKSVPGLFTKKPYIPEVRALLQNYGTEVRRNDDPTYWTNKWRKAVLIHDKVIVDDVRFLNEVNNVKLLHGTIYKLDREKANKHTDKHASEAEMKAIKGDYTIDNNGTLEELYKQLDEIMIKT